MSEDWTDFSSDADGIIWSAPVMTEDNKYLVTATVYSSLGCCIRIGYNLCMPDEVRLRSRRLAFHETSLSEQEAVVRCCNSQNAEWRRAVRGTVLNKLRELESGQADYGMTHCEFATLSVEERDAKIAAWNEKRRSVASAAWSAELRHKVAIGEAVNQQRLPSVVIEHDLDDEPWRTW